MQRNRIKVPVWDRAKNEMELFRLLPSTTAEANLSVTTHIVLRDVEFVDGKPVIALFNEFVRIVEGIVMAVEAEAHRLGL